MGNIVIKDTFHELFQIRDKYFPHQKAEDMHNLDNVLKDIRDLNLNLNHNDTNLVCYRDAEDEILNSIVGTETLYFIFSNYLENIYINVANRSWRNNRERLEFVTEFAKFTETLRKLQNVLVVVVSSSSQKPDQYIERLERLIGHNVRLIETYCPHRLVRDDLVYSPNGITKSCTICNYYKVY